MKKIYTALTVLFLSAAVQAQNICENFDGCGTLTPQDREHTFNLYGNGNPGCLSNWEVVNGTPSVYNSFVAPYSGTDYALLGVHNSTTTEGAALKYNFQMGNTYTVTMAISNNNSNLPLNIDFVLLDAAIPYTYTTGVGASALPAIPASGFIANTVTNFTSTSWQVVSFTVSNLTQNFNRLWIRQTGASSNYLFVDSLCITQQVSNSYCESFDACGTLSAFEREHTFNLFGNGNPGCLADWEVTSGTPSIYNSFVTPYDGTDYALLGVHNSTTVEGAALKYNFTAGNNYTVTLAMSNYNANIPLNVDFILLDAAIPYTYTTGVGASAIPAIPASAVTVHSVTNFTSTSWQLVTFTISGLTQNFNRFWIRQTGASSNYLFVDALCITQEISSGHCITFDNCGSMTAPEREHAFNNFGNGNSGCLEDWEVVNGTPSIYNTLGAPYSGTDYALFGVHNSTTTESAALKYDFQAGITFTVTMALRNNDASAPLNIDFVLLDAPISYTYNTGVGSSALPAIPSGGVVAHTISNFTSATWQVVTFTFTNLAGYSRMWIRQTAPGSTYLFVDDICISESKLSGINNLKEELLSIYPNPATNQLNISVEGNAATLTTIFDLQGKAVMQSTSDKSINIADLANGIYIAEVKTANGTARKRWIKM